MEPVEQQERVEGISLTTKLLAAFLVASLLPLIVISAYQLKIGMTILNDTASEEINLLAIGLADKFDLLLHDTYVSTVQLGSDPAAVQALLDPSEANLRAVENRFQYILESDSSYEYVYLLNADGLTLVSVHTEDRPSITGGNFGDREYFIHAMQGAPYIDALVGRVSKKLGFFFSAPVVSPQDGLVLGVVAIKVRGATVDNLFQAFNASTVQQVSAFLVDHQGVVVIPPTHRPTWRLKGIRPLSPEEQAVAQGRFVLEEPPPYLNIPDLEALTQADGGIARYRDPQDDRNYIVGYHTTRHLNWVVGVVMAEEVYRGPIIRLGWQSAAGALVAALLVIWMAVLLARGIARPILKLAATARDISRDESFEPQRIADVSERRDEVGLLARVFRDMVLALHARMAELRTINEIGRQIVSSVDLTDTLSQLIASLGEVIAFDAAEICLYNARNEVLELYVTHDEIVSDDETVAKVTYRPDDDFFPRLFSQRDALLVPAIAPEEEHLRAERSWKWVEPQSYLGIALWHRHKVVGTIEMVSSKTQGFTEDNRRMLENISLQAAVAVSNAQEVRERERRLINMEIVVDEERVEREVQSVLRRDIVRRILKRDS